MNTLEMFIDYLCCQSGLFMHQVLLLQGTLTKKDTRTLDFFSRGCCGFCFIACQFGMNHERASLVVQMVKDLPAMPETWFQYLGQEDPLEKGMATHSSILAWRIP